MHTNIQAAWAHQDPGKKMAMSLTPLFSDCIGTYDDLGSIRMKKNLYMSYIKHKNEKKILKRGWSGK